MLAEQTFLNAGPLLVKGSAGAAAAGFIFNILMIARAPLQLFQAVSTSLLPHLTRLRSEGKRRRLPRLGAGDDPARSPASPALVGVAMRSPAPS